MVVTAYRSSVRDFIPGSAVYVLAATREYATVALVSPRGTAYRREDFSRLVGFRLARIDEGRADKVARLWGRGRADADTLLALCRARRTADS